MGDIVALIILLILLHGVLIAYIKFMSGRPNN